MANETAPDELAVELSEPVSDWLEAIAAERGMSEGEVLRQLLDGAVDGMDEETVERRLEALESSLRDRLEELDADFQAKIEDVRERVIQVKRETDAKAPVDHGHEGLERRVEDLGAGLDDVESELDDAVDRFERGFENYEEILEYLTETTDDLDRKLDALATAVVDLRDGFEALDRERARRKTLDRLTATANRHDVRRARCDACENRIDVGLLAEPRCPHCEEPFVDLDPGRRFFGANRLETAPRPALEGEVADGDDRGTPFDGMDVDPTERGGPEPPTGIDDLTGGGPPGDERGPDTDRDGTAGPEGLRSIRGIGSKYADRLSDAGVETVAGLAAADPETLADETGISATRIERWIDRVETSRER